MKAPANSKDLYIVIGHIYKTSSKQTDIVSITIGGLSLAGVLAIAIYYLSR